MNTAWLTGVMMKKSPEELKTHMKTIEAFRNDNQEKLHTVAEIKAFLESFVMVTSNVREDGIEIAASGGAALVTPAAVERMICAVVARYLRQWFTNANNPRSSIYEFSNYDYMHPSDSKYTGKPQMEDNARRKVLETAMEKQQDFMDLRLGQILQKPDASMENASGKQKYDYVKLAWIDQYCDGYLGYIGLVFLRKEIMRQTQNKERYEPLGEVSQQYRKNLIRVRELYAMIDSSGGKYRVARCREYLASCMLIDWLENGLHFHRACRIAAHLTGAYPQQQEPDKEAAECFWHPIESKNDSREMMKGCGQEGIPQIDHPWDVLNYEEEIAAVYAVPSPETEQKCVGNLVLREKYLELQNLLYAYCPPEKQPKWTPELYLEAAHFFHDEYPIIEQYAAMEFPEVESVFYPLAEGQTRRRRRNLENDFYQNLEKVFLEILEVEDSPLDHARQYFRSAKQKK